MEWASDYQENQITILYDSMWENTRKMAEAISQGIKLADSDVTIKLFNVARSDKNTVITEVFKSKAILVGSSTINNGILSSTAGILEEIKGLAFKNKKAAAFGSYGWSGQSVKIINEEIIKCGFSLVNEGIRILWTPDDIGINNCIEFGKEFTKKI